MPRQSFRSHRIDSNCGRRFELWFRREKNKNMLVRRLLASLLHSQQRRILTSPAVVGSVSSSRGAKVEPIKLVNRSPIFYLKKILQQSIQVILFGRNRDNILLANTALNRALNYSGHHHMSAPSPGPGPSEEQQQEIDAGSLVKNKENPPAASRPIEALDKPGTLDELREKYMEARKEASNCWLQYSNGSCYIYLYRGGGEPSHSMAAFDLDGTIIRPKSNKRIPRSATDWEFFSVWTKVKLQQCLRDSGARFVIFTNQNGVGLNLVPLDEVQKRIELVVKRLDIACTVFMAVEKDEFRKPGTGMFQLFELSFNDSLQLDYTCSFYCGDAIGYPSHSDADIKFAQRLGLPFLTPDKFVRGVKPKLVS